MNITVYDKLYEALDIVLKKFNTESGYNVGLAPFEPAEPQYPLVIFDEIRNQPQTVYYSSREEISSLGYRVDIFAKTATITPPNGKKGQVTKQQICRNIMQVVTDFLQKRIKLRLISNNSFPSVGTQGELYQIVLVFQRPHYDNREQFV